MKRTRIALSEAAASDILEQADWYDARSENKLAERWERAVSKTLLRIAARPLSGMRCGFKAKELAGVRRMSVAGFPKHLVFYQVSAKETLVLRIVHGARDLESLF